MQERCNSGAPAMELRHSYTNPSIYTLMFLWMIVGVSNCIPKTRTIFSNVLSFLMLNFQHIMAKYSVTNVHMAFSDRRIPIWESVNWVLNGSGNICSKIVPCHYLTRCWLIVIWTLGNTFLCNWNQDKRFYTHGLFTSMTCGCNALSLCLSLSLYIYIYIS